VVVDDFDMRRSSLIPYETYAPLIVDAHRVLSLPISPYTKVAQHPGLIQKTKLSQSDGLDVCRQFRIRRPDQINSASESAKP
jgi:hypothetical protein